MKFSIKNLSKGLLFTAVLLAAGSCTKKFEEYNTDPTGITDESLKQDFNYVGAYFQQMQQNIYNVTPAWNYQLQQNLLGDVYSGYMMPPTPFRGNDNNMTYALVDGWNGFPWDDGYNAVMAPALVVKNRTAGDAKFQDFYAWSLILKVAAMHRVSDIYGPIIYSQYGNGKTEIDYDSQQEVYNQFFTELKQAVDVLTPLANDPNAPKQLAKFDLAYGGDYAKWVKFANSLRLRLAIRISKVDPAKAKTEAEAAVSHSIGVMASNADNFNVGTTGQTHPLNVINNAWNDIRMGAPMESILGGYSDPRLGKFFQTSDIEPGKHKGIRNGIDIKAKADYTPFSKLGTFIETATTIQLMTYAEVRFLLAEAALRGWAVTGDAQAHYEAGISNSMDQWGVAGAAAAYIADGTSKPLGYTDPVDNANSLDQTSQWISKATIKWNNGGSFDEKLEKIITQKWIAMYPEGQEAWSEFRRTGYPKLMPIVLNNSGGKIPTETFIRRVNFIANEYSTNAAAVGRAVTLLGGPDNGGTRLWWDKP